MINIPPDKQQLVFILSLIAVSFVMYLQTIN